MAATRSASFVFTYIAEFNVEVDTVTASHCCMQRHWYSRVVELPIPGIPNILSLLSIDWARCKPLEKIVWSYGRFTVWLLITRVSWYLLFIITIVVMYDVTGWRCGRGLTPWWKSARWCKSVLAGTKPPSNRRRGSLRLWYMSSLDVFFTQKWNLQCITQVNVKK